MQGAAAQLAFPWLLPVRRRRRAQHAEGILLAVGRKAAEVGASVAADRTAAPAADRRTPESGDGEVLAALARGMNKRANELTGASSR